MKKEEEIEEKYKGFYGNHNTVRGCNLDTSPDSKRQLAQRARRARERHESGACPYERCAPWGQLKCVCNELGEDPLRQSPPGRPGGLCEPTRRAYMDKAKQKRLELFGKDQCIDGFYARQGRSTAEDELEDGEDGEDTDKEGWGAYEF